LRRCRVRSVTGNSADSSLMLIFRVLPKFSNACFWTPLRERVTRSRRLPVVA
jgi:hypothetical protein